MVVAGQGVGDIGGAVMAGDGGGTAQALLGTASNIVNDYDATTATGLEQYSVVANDAVNAGIDQGIQQALNVGVNDSMAATRQTFYGEEAPSADVGVKQQIAAGTVPQPAPSTGPEIVHLDANGNQLSDLQVKNILENSGVTTAVVDTTVQPTAI